MRQTDDFTKVREAINLEDGIAKLTGLAKKGHHLEACPFCSGHNCFSIDNQKRQWHCFQCGDNNHGDIFDFISALRNCSPHEALQEAADMAGIVLAAPEKKKSRPVTAKEQIFLAAAGYYAAKMANGGKEYIIKQRGHAESVIAEMGIGYADGGLYDHLLTENFRSEDILASGLVKEKDINGEKRIVDFFKKGLVIFPHYIRKQPANFTMKDPEKKLAYQLPAEKRDKDWRFYNQDALSAYDEIFLVEGENDLLSVMDAGHRNVIAIIGQVSNEQIDALKSYCERKILYVWVDNDEAGVKYIRKITAGLNGHNVTVRIIDYEGKDPDEYIQKTEPAERRVRVRDLKLKAIDYLTWEIRQAGKQEDLNAALEHLRKYKVFTHIGLLPEIERTAYKKHVERLGFSAAGIQDEITATNSLKQELDFYFENVGDMKNASPLAIADIIFSYFNRVGRFFYDRYNNVFLLYKGDMLEVSVNRKFNALMKRYTSMLPNRNPGPQVWEALASDGMNKGIRIDVASWLHTDYRTQSVFINLNSPNNKIIKISERSIEELTNGINDDNILLRASQKIDPFTYLPDTSIKEGLQMFGELVMKSFACDDRMKYFLATWFFSSFLYDFSPYIGLMRLAGSTSVGKTTPAKFLSTLLYGHPALGDTSAAAAYSAASQNPILILDNLEKDDMNKQLQKFLLLSATKGSKMKRASGTDSGTVEEVPRSLILVTSIEPFVLPELINRTYEISFMPQFKSDSFVETDITRELEQKRNFILSAILKFIAHDVLPNMQKKAANVTYIRTAYKDHAKNRTDEYLALLKVILGAFLKYVPHFSPDNPAFADPMGEENLIFAHWIETQNSLAKDNEKESNVLMKFLEGITNEYLHHPANKDSKYIPDTQTGEIKKDLYHHEYLLHEVYITQPELKRDGSGEEYFSQEISIIATGNELASAFDKYARNTGGKNPYSSASVLGARLRNDIKTLEKAGWCIAEDYVKTVKGGRYWQIWKRIIR